MKCPTFVPGLPILSSTSDVSNCQNSSQMSDKYESGDAITWCDGDIKAPVAIEKSWVGAVQFDSLLVNNKHGYLSAILGGIEDLAKQKDRPFQKTMFRRKKKNNELVVYSKAYIILIQSRIGVTRQET